MNVTVTIPVGPYPANKRWLKEAILSAIQPGVDEILLIDDMANLDPRPEWSQTKIWRAPWHIGVAAAFNFGVMLARNECVFMLGSDDWLEPYCIAECVKAYQAQARPDEVYYPVGVHYLDGREDPDQYIPCGAAMVTKSLWRRCGGFPLESFTAADAALLSIFMKHPAAGKVVPVGGRQTLYNYRVHEETDTVRNKPWNGVLGAVRGLATELWPPPWLETQAKSSTEVS